MIRISRREFEQLVEQALGELPDRFAALLDNVAIVVEEEPSDEDLDVMDEDANELLGIYRGVPITERHYDSMRLPDQIAIFRGPILRVARSRSDALHEIRDTVVHELGHYFGLDDEGMAY
ncbi:MAG: metallopeptidase family protein [Acidobacteriota bacterium]